MSDVYNIYWYHKAGLVMTVLALLVGLFGAGVFTSDLHLTALPALLVLLLLSALSFFVILRDMGFLRRQG